MDDFVTEWNALAPAKRKELQRLARAGRRPGADPDRRLVVDYARFQRTQVWVKYFWLWFVPGLVLALGAAAQIHSFVMGIVFGFAILTANTWRHLRRLARTEA